MGEAVQTPTLKIHRRPSSTMTHIKLCVFLACMVALTVAAPFGKKQFDKKEANDLVERGLEDLVERSLEDLAKKEAPEEAPGAPDKREEYACVSCGLPNRQWG